MTDGDESPEHAILRMAEAREWQTLVDFGLPHVKDINKFAALQYALLHERRYEAVALLARAAMAIGANSWIIRVFFILASIALGREGEAAGPMDSVRIAIESVPAEVRARMKNAASPMVNECVTAAVARGNFGQIDRFMEFWTLLAPEDTAPLAVPKVVPPYDPSAGAARRDAGPARLVFTGPPAGVARRERTAVVAMRTLFFPTGGIRSREHDIGPRIVAGSVAYGWSAVFHGMTMEERTAGVRELHEIHRLAKERGADLLLIDQLLVGDEGDGVARAVAAMRRDLPGLKIVACYFDPWSRDFWPGMRRAAPLADLIWSVSPGLRLWDEPVFAGKLHFAPLPCGGEFDYPPPAAARRLAFFGGIGSHNWQRGLWLAALLRAGLALDVAVVSHAADSLPPLESFHAYMRRIQEKTFILSLAIREDGSLSLTGRTFEVPIAGGLLIQERSADVARYFTEGEHYLAFSTMTELCSIARFIADEPGEAEAVRRRGYDFARAHYSDKAIIGYLDGALYGGGGR